ncbi:MAG: polysaccharide pyruvyl transferase family protein [Myxococcales bacterium]
MTPPAITLFGNFGTQNLGNEYTLQAIVENLRRIVPGARINCVCPEPRDAAARHGISAFLMSYRYAPEYRSRPRRRAGIFKWLRRVLVRLPLELFQWALAFKALKGTRLLVMTGTGMLGDFGIGPFDLHYEILKWSLVAKLRGAKLLFVSVGAGPIADPLSRWIVKRALALADYRSYRDAFSREYLARIGFDTGRDFVYPDLAFSLQPSVPDGRERPPDDRVVAMGLMDYYGTRSSPARGEDVYRRYVEKTAAFAGWLLDRGYTVELLVGDVAYDTRVQGDVRRIVGERVGDGRGRLVERNVSSAEELLAHLAKTDMVVATRFHNIVLALMLDKPVVALSYHEKIASLMSGVGLADFCQEVDTLDVSGLVERFTRLEREAAAARSLIGRRTAEYRKALDEQYARISRMFESQKPRA